jgi:hypothetical protein
VTLVDALNSLEEAVAHTEFTGYGPREIPHKLDSLPEAVVDLYLAADSHDKELVSCLSAVAAQVLCSFAERLSAVAVRNESAVALKRSLLALGIAASIETDERNVLSVASLPWHSAKLLGINPSVVFMESAMQLPRPGREFLLAFSRRPPESRSIACMGYIEGSDNDGFRYERTW